MELNLKHEEVYSSSTEDEEIFGIDDTREVVRSLKRKKKLKELIILKWWLFSADS